MRRPSISSHMVDMDELLQHCRDDASKVLMQEAVASYHAGAYRSAIISSWIAVFVDLVAKIRSLSLAGDQSALSWIVRFDKLALAYDPQQQNTITPFQNLESRIINDAQNKFELLSPLEGGDLKRLRADRHRSAHPAMRTKSELFAPTAELARNHIRNAVEIVLSRPAIRGEIAVRRIMATVLDEGFPSDAIEASEIVRDLEITQLNNESLSLLFQNLLQDIFDEETSRAGRRKSLMVTSVMKDFLPDFVDSYFTPLLSKHLEVNNLFTWDVLVSMIDLQPWISTKVDSLHRGRLNEFVRSIESQEVENWPFLARCLRIQLTKDVALSTVSELPAAFMKTYRHLIPTEILLDEGTDRLSQSGSWNTTYSICDSLIIPNVNALSAEHISKIKSSILQRSNVNGSVVMYDLIRNILLLNDPEKLGDQDTWGPIIESCKSIEEAQVSDLHGYVENAYSDSPLPW